MRTSRALGWRVCKRLGLGLSRPVDAATPKLIVQVKTPQVGSEVVSQLNGLVSTHGADYGLLVTWAGLTKPARDAVKHQRFRVKVSESEDVVEAVLRNYEKLPETITERLPLRRVWMLKDV